MSAIGISLTWKGIPELQRLLDEHGGRFGRAAMASALCEEAELIMTDAKRRCPVDTGTLRNSGFVEPAKWDGRGNVSITLGFGGAAKNYAIVQHEDLSLRHTVGEAKFLEKPMLAARDGFGARLQRRLRAALARMTR